MSFLYPAAASAGVGEGEQERETEMKMRLCIHSDINDDDESGEVEQHGTVLRAFFIWCCNTYVGILYTV